MLILLFFLGLLAVLALLQRFCFYQYHQHIKDDQLIDRTLFSIIQSLTVGYVEPFARFTGLRIPVVHASALADMEHNNIEQSESSSCQPSSLPLTSQEQSINSSGALSRRASIAEGDVKPPKGKKLRVQFDESVHSPSERPVSHVGGEASLLGSLAGAKQMPTDLIDPGHTRQGSRSRLPQGADDASTDITELHLRPFTKPSLGKFSLGPDDSDLEDNTEENDDDEERPTMDEKEMSQRTAHAWAESLSRSLREQGSQHAQSSRNPTAGSPPESPPDSPTYATNKPLDLNNIPLEKLAKKRKRFSVEDESDTEDEEDDEPGMTPAQRRIRRLKAAVASLIGTHHKSTDSGSLFRVKAANSGNTSGHVTPIDEHGDPVEYIERPSRYRTGVLGSLMRLYDDEGAGGGLGFRSAHLANAIWCRHTSAQAAVVV